MKISKVKNTRSAIAKKKEKASVGGVLYTHPNGEVSELKKRFDPNTTWYLQFHFVCAKLFVVSSCLGMITS